MATEGHLTEIHQFTKSYKHMWARDVAQATMKYDSEGLIKLMKGSVPGIKGNENIGQLHEMTKDKTGAGYIPESPGKIDVGIVGAGVAGLFTALLFDWLNAHPDLKGKGLKINYDILEAAGAGRLGGRLYTHHFSDEEHDYYDVGAMRFPNNTIMKSLLQTDPSELVKKALEAFTKEAKKRLDAAIDEEKNEKKHPAEQPDGSTKTDGKYGSKGPAATALWKLLMKADLMSMRQFLGSEKLTITYKGQRKKDEEESEDQQEQNDQPEETQPLGEDDFPKGPGYNFNTIEWLETMTYGTGWYDQSLTECALEELDFQTPDKKDIQYWWCIDGGAQEIAKKMATKAKKRIEYNTKVQSIDAQVPLRREREPHEFTSIKIKTTRTDPKTKKVESKDREYFAIFNSTTLAALQRMELRDAGLSWGTKQAIRALGYGASAKVGMKFRTAWWQKKPFNISKGGVSRTDLPLRVCVYPSYNIKSNEGEDKWDPEKPAVLLCSYTWGQDAQRIGSLCSNNTAQNDEELKRLMIHDLARLHARKEYPFKRLVKFLEEQYIDHHGYDWYRDQHMSGAFAYFGPGQFSNMWQEIIKPNSFGQLYLVGEAASSHHAWIVGALESVIRAVYVMFQGLQNGNKDFEAYGIVLNLLRNAPDGRDEHGNDEKNVDLPLKENGALPTGLPFHPLPEEMPERQLRTPKNRDLTDSPEEEASKKEVDMTYGAALAVLSLIESFFELGLDQNDQY
ncbi:hypothetical protein NCS52_00410100 [Fusarium sp. LHS14.1]|nr:hypothetical protein NCS52_00410100 [Fusarium sp. LHS14.1]